MTCIPRNIFVDGERCCKPFFLFSTVSVSNLTKGESRGNRKREQFSPENKKYNVENFLRDECWTARQTDMLHRISAFLKVRLDVRTPSPCALLSLLKMT